jgi:DNA repair exonuclease SbcCD ATPase subunit
VNANKLLVSDYRSVLKKTRKTILKFAQELQKPKADINTLLGQLNCQIRFMADIQRYLNSLQNHLSEQTVIDKALKRRKKKNSVHSASVKEDVFCLECGHEFEEFHDGLGCMQVVSDVNGLRVPCGCKNARTV